MVKNSSPGDKNEAGRDGDANFECDAPQVVVAVGSSAGGLYALESLLAHATPGAGLGYVVVQHLSPNQPSNLVELLRPRTKLRVVTATADARVEADTVHIVAPDTLLRLDGGRLQTASPMPSSQRFSPIDALFESLAIDQGERAVCVVLSGTGSDGTLGMKAIKEHSGVTIAQAHPAGNGDSSFHGGMPDSAVASGLVDHVLPAESIAPWIQSYVKHLQHLHHEVGPQSLEQDITQHLGDFVELLLARTGRDFRGYKTGTLIRRLQRRLHVQQMTSAADYLNLLREDANERERLIGDFLVGVTRFFRDPEAFETLNRDVLGKIAESNRGGEVRVWVAGCATGEEAYSVAILLREHLDGLDRPLTVQIFATDIAAEAVAHARVGHYADAAVADINPTRLARFFTRSEGGYQVSQEIRDMCVFSWHDLTSDPPFSRMDLICCRNVLIYMQPELQKRFLAIFHYGLKPGGYLWLGPSEAVTAHPPLFDTVDKKYRIFVRRDDVSSPLLDLPLPSGPKGWSGKPALPGRRSSGKPQPDIGSRARDIVVERYTPAYAVVDENLNALFLSSGIGSYLEPPTGRVTANILNMARSGLRLDLRAALHHAARSGDRVEHAGVRIRSEGGEQRVTVVVDPIVDADQSPSRRYLVVFQDERVSGTEAAGTTRTQECDETIRQLEAELEETKERLGITVEELETSYEELQSSNEELLSMNEELQSSNEELGTSKEELQSVNEELETINQELGEKVQELSRANSDLKNLLDSTQLATLFLDRNLRVRWFNPAASDVFRLRESDHDRPITDLVSKLKYDDLEKDARQVLRSLESIEREVASGDGRTQYLLRISPYRTVDDIIDGVVVVCVNISERRNAEANLARAEQRIVEILEGIEGGFFAVDTSGTVTYANRNARRLFRGGRKRLEGRSIQSVFAVGDDPGADDGSPLGLPATTVVDDKLLHVRVIPAETGAMVFMQESDPKGED